MTSIPDEFKTIRSAMNSTPLILSLTLGHSKVALISPPGELTSIVFFKVCMSKVFFFTKCADIKECDAPESNKTEAE
jgi:hypothetical protein